MASRAVVTAVEARLAGNWTHTSIIGANTDGETPADGSAFLTVQYPVALSTHIGMAGVGNRTFREEGTFRLVLSVPRGDGQDQGLGWCDDLIALFIAQQFDGVTARTPSPPVVHNGENDRGQYWVMSVSVPYFYDLFA